MAMHRLALTLLLAAVGFGGVRLTCAVPPNASRTLAWSDEFDGTSLDSSKWSWGSLPWGGRHHYDEHASYIMPEDPLLADGVLVLRCREGDFGGYLWSDGFVHSNAEFRYRHGDAEIRAC
jgi:beta-glucanase (GH16 family)